jgi:hypothetical protein
MKAVDAGCGLETTSKSSRSPGEIRVWCEDENFHAAEVRIFNAGDIAINTDDDFVRPDLPSARDREDVEEDIDYRRGDRYDVRRGEYSRDDEHLRILSILYYVFGGLGAFSGLFPLMYVAMGVAFLSGSMGPPRAGGAGGPPPELGWIFIVLGGGLSFLIWSLAACTLFAAYNLSKKRRYLFCFVIACLSCASIPLGTILGVFTIVVLARPGVKELFDQSPTETLPTEAR